ncbi:uncharacterized protein YbjT (DUF2867 family) [Nocardiopsis mwathae]|uniref:Uncharacterized protein YbjT (DUF2867 family) n=1 Tax=Nocardiopsis mwathae TaxID=1472723 RepID=A0A7X0D3S9_9ACTN|nr:uncharacterized protein YbjT (DUF2867 family) [Nocardiopsis mwathae]
MRPGGFAANALLWADDIRRDGVVSEPFGQASKAVIHERDIAGVAVQALTAAGHAGRTYVVTGPEPVTTADQVRIIGEVIDRPVGFNELTPQDVRDHMVSQGYSADEADSMVGAYVAMSEKDGEVTETVEEVTGTPARTFRQWVADHAADFD